MPEALGADGVNLLNSCGSAAWQTVFHFHMHVIPRYADDTAAPALDARATAASASTRRGGGAARMTAFGPWTLEQDGPLAVLTIDKPPLNLFDREVDDGLHAAIRHVATERAARPAAARRGPRLDRRRRRQLFKA